jgi:inner membrane protein
MRGYGHAAIGTAAAAAAAAAAHAPAQDTAAALACAAVGSVLPDIDTSPATSLALAAAIPALLLLSASQGLLPHAAAAHASACLGALALGAALTGHRGLTHSAAGAALAWGGASSLLPLACAAAAELGYLLHLAADSLTPMGVPWLYPLARRRARAPERRSAHMTGTRRNT